MTTQADVIAAIQALPVPDPNTDLQGRAIAFMGALFAGIPGLNQDEITVSENGVVRVTIVGAKATVTLQVSVTFPT